jgi:dTMP kinase
MKGTFLVMEGLDGSGKTSTIKLLSSFFKNIGRKHIVVTQPSQTLIGGLIRSRLRKEWECNGGCLQALYLADGINTINKEILPNLKKGIDVICDRYSLSAYAYGSVGADYNWLKNSFDVFINPDITFFLDVPVTECVKRLQKEKESLELYENENILNRVYNNYLRAINDFKEQHNIVKINGNQSIEKVSEDIKNILKNIEDTSFDSDCP